MGSNRRTKFVVNPKFQVSYLLHLTLAISVSCGTFYLGLVFFYRKALASMEYLGFGADTPVMESLLTQFHGLNQVLLFAFISILLVFLILGLIISNRIAGPVFRLTRYLDNYDPAKKEPFMLRKHDYFTELVDCVNRFIQRKY